MDAETQAESGAHAIYIDSVPCTGANMCPLYVANIGLPPVKARGVPKCLIPSMEKEPVYNDSVPCTRFQMYFIYISLPVRRGQR
jgi:hypothetical protein